MKIKSKIRGGATNLSALTLAQPVINPRRGCGTVTPIRPIVLTTIALA
jgi:hypothetical protein